MATRKQVDISETQHRQLEDLREQCRKNKGLVPSIPALVALAINRALPALVEQFTEKNKGNGQ